MSAILGSVGDIFTAAIGWVETVIKFIVGGTVGTGEHAVVYTAQPLLMLFILVPLVGLAIGLFSRIKRV